MTQDEMAAARARLDEEAVDMVGVCVGATIERWGAAREALVIHAPDDLRKALDALDRVRKLQRYSPSKFGDGSIDEYDGDVAPDDDGWLVKHDELLAAIEGTKTVR
jgi:hypothetical protein